MSNDKVPFWYTLMMNIRWVARHAQFRMHYDVAANDERYKR